MRSCASVTDRASVGRPAEVLARRAVAQRRRTTRNQGTADSRCFPRVCPQFGGRLLRNHPFPVEFGEGGGLKNRRLSLLFLRNPRRRPRDRPQCARECARCREAHPRQRVTRQSPHALTLTLQRRRCLRRSLRSCAFRLSVCISYNYQSAVRWPSGRRRRFAKPNRIPSGCDKTGQNSRFPVNIPRSQFCPVSPDAS